MQGKKESYMLTMLFYRENGSTIECKNKKEGGVILLPSWPHFDHAIIRRDK
jgi:hypothetical protein